MGEDNLVLATVVDLPSLSTNFPQVPIPELTRDNVVSTIERLLEGTAHGVTVEGDEGMGKTTVLSQFARKQPKHAISVFVSASNKLSSDPDLILQDLLTQVAWILAKEPMKPGAADLSTLKSYYGALQRDARRRDALFYFIVDGAEELDAPRRAMLIQHLSDILPVGVPQFRCLFSGNVEIYRSLFPRGLPIQPYPLNLLSIQETKTLLPEDISNEQLTDLHGLCRGIPGRVASVLRVLKTGVSLSSYLENAPSKSPEFFEAEWRQVPDNDEQVKQILALLAHDSKPHSAPTVAGTLGLTALDVEQTVARLNFLTIDAVSTTIHFASGSLRKFIATKLTDRKQQVLKKLIKRLLALPESDESIFELPAYLEEAAEFLNVLDLLTPDHILEVLKRGESLAKVNDAVQRGLRAARKLSKDHELLRFGIQSAVIAELESSGIWVSEVEAHAALGRDNEAQALVNNAVLCEDRLQLLSALAASIWKRGDSVSRDLIAQIRSLIERTDSRSLRRRARSVASQLICVSPDLAIAVLDKAKGASSEENDLDHAFFHASIRALSGVEDEKRREELLRNISLISPEPEMQVVFSGLRLLSVRLSAAEVRSTVEAISETAGKMSILRAWCVLNAEHPEAGLIAEYALDTALKATAYTIDASVLADLSKPVRHVVDSASRSHLISRLDVLSGTAARLGPSIKYVQFQLALAAVEAVDQRSACDGRLTRLFDYVAHIEDLPTKAEAFASLLGALKMLHPAAELAGTSKLEASCTGEIEAIVLSLAEATADHYLAFKGLICALGAAHLDKALDYVRLVNTEVRRDEILDDLVRALVHRPADEVDTLPLKRLVDRINAQDWRDSALETIMERFGDESNVPDHILDGLGPIINDLDHISDSVIACRAMVCAFNLLTRNPSSQRDRTRAHLWSQMRERWSHIDVGWRRIDVGFGIANDLAGSCREFAAIMLEETEELKEKWRISAYEPASAYVGCIRLVIRAFQGLLPKKLETKADIEKMVSLIDVLPSYGERAILWADLCMRCSLADRQDLCELLVRQYLRPVLDQIPAADGTYRARVLISTAPPLYKVLPISCLEMLGTLDRDRRDLALRDIIRFSLHRRVPSDPKDSWLDPDNPVSYDLLLEVLNVLDHVNTDWMIHVVAEEIADLLDSKTNRNSLNNPQREVIARRIETIAKTKLPLTGQIEHRGWQILTLARAYCIRRARGEEWECLISDAKALNNLADKAFVLHHIALCIPSAVSAQRASLLEESAGMVAQIPSVTDKIERYVGFAEDLEDVDKTRCRGLLAAASDIFPRTLDELRDEHHQLVDIAFRVDESFASALIDRLDDDRAKQAAQAQLRLLKLRREVFDDVASTQAIEKIGTRDLPRVGWMFVRALGSRRLQTFNPNAIRDYLDAAAAQPLRRAYSTLLWYIENAVTRFSETDHAITFLRPLFDSCVVSAQLAGQVAGKTLTRLRALKDRSAEVSLGHGTIISAGSQDQAMRIISEWFENHPGEFVKIADPYFGPSDLHWLQVIRSVKPDSRITVMTSRAHQPTLNPGEQLEDRYMSEWRRRFDQPPPKTEIAVIGGEHTSQSPVHDRWILTKSGGLRLGTSLNSLGIGKDSEISELSQEEAEDRLAQVEQYLTGEKMEFKGERLRLSTFRLIV